MSRQNAKSKTPWWQDLPTEELLDVRLCDLELSIQGTALEDRIQQLHDELSRKELRFKPYTWLSTDWFTPEGSTGFAVPFYLAHPRLVRLEHSQMFEAEGSTHSWCMKLLRHEAGHALDNAYDLHRRTDWRRAFGAYSSPYRAAYRVNPTSKNYVLHLGQWYAQSHPAEDYAESFAVWLAPKSGWQRQYEGWGALDKLHRVDEIVHDVGREKPLRSSRDRPESLPRQRLTLREYYRGKKAEMARARGWRFDHELRLLFDERGEGSRRERAATFLRRERQSLRKKISALTGQYRYLVDQVLDQMIQRCRELDLRVEKPRSQARLGAAVLVTMGTMQLTKGYRPRFRR
ncbi:MAG: hypothetical protein AB8H80_10235 [Planctomycetota bacterium]